MAALVSLLLIALAQAAATEDTVRLVRAATGPGGTAVGGRYVLKEERSTFTRVRDPEVAANFEWEGPVGRHRLSATWRHIETGSSSTSHLDYDARDRRFGAYWTFPLSASTLLGRWRVEVAVDGQPAGALDFDVVDVEDRAAPSRRVFTPAQLYERARTVIVMIERLNAVGGVIGVGAGFLAGERAIVTSFAAVDAADAVRATLPDGTRVSVTALAGWSRPQGWAVIDGNFAKREVLPRAKSAPSVGERCIAFEAGAEGAQILLEGSIVGQHSTPKSGTRFLGSFATGIPTRGSPVMNEYGEITALVAGGPGFGVRDVPRLLVPMPPDVPGVPLIPIALVPQDQQTPVPLTDLVKRGVLIQPLVGERNILSGGFAHKFIKQGPGSQPVDQRSEFTRADGTMVVFVTWLPQERIRGLMTLQIYDEESRVIGRSKPRKVNFRVGSTILADFSTVVPEAPGIYRAEVSIDDRPAWRDFFRVAG